MRFIRYYSKLLEAQGMPHLSVGQHKRLFNIISLESRLDELLKIREGIMGIDVKYDCQIRIFSIRDQLKKLTDNKHPKEVLAHMLWESENK